MNKKFSIILLVGIASLVLVPTNIMAGGTNCPQEGLVPCGTEGCPCQFCDFFVMFDRIMDFILKGIVPPIAVLLFVVGGIMFLLAGGDPTAAGKAKKILTATVIGLAIIYGSFLLLSTFLSAIGVAEWTGLGEWFKYPCF